MSGDVQRRYDDIAIIQFRRDHGGHPPNEGGSPIRIILLTVLITVLLIFLGCFICIRTGVFAPPVDPCCYGVLDFDFNF